MMPFMGGIRSLACSCCPGVAAVAWSAAARWPSGRPPNPRRRGRGRPRCPGSARPAALAAERGRACRRNDSMRVIEVREDNPWPKWTEATQVVEGMHKPVFVRPVLAKRDDGEIAWPSVQIRIGGLGARQGAKFNGHTLAEAKEKADRLRADAQSSGHSGTVPFKVPRRAVKHRPGFPPRAPSQAEGLRVGAQ